MTDIFFRWFSHEDSKRREFAIKLDERYWPSQWNFESVEIWNKSKIGFCILEMTILLHQIEKRSREEKISESKIRARRPFSWPRSKPTSLNNLFRSVHRPPADGVALIKPNRAIKEFCGSGEQWDGGLWGLPYLYQLVHGPVLCRRRGISPSRTTRYTRPRNPLTPFLLQLHFLPEMVELSACDSLNRRQRKQIYVLTNINIAGVSFWRILGTRVMNFPIQIPIIPIFPYPKITIEILWKNQWKSFILLL
jgi:hypothetical protein